MRLLGGVFRGEGVELRRSADDGGRGLFPLMDLNLLFFVYIYMSLVIITFEIFITVIRIE